MNFWRADAWATTLWGEDRHDRCDTSNELKEGLIEACRETGVEALNMADSVVGANCWMACCQTNRSSARRTSNLCLGSALFPMTWLRLADSPLA